MRRLFHRLTWLAGMCGSLAFCGADSTAPDGSADSATAERLRDDLLAKQEGIYLPYRYEDPVTPPTRTLDAQEAEELLQRDWLFQAEAKPLAERTAEEIGWARQLAVRLARSAQAPDLRRDLAELDVLEKRLQALGKAPPARPAPAAEGRPAWIWFPEGRPAQDAPAESRFFRRTFEVPAGRVRQAELCVTADDACEVFLNGLLLGNHGGWNHAATFAIEQQLKPGRNVLAVRAENKPAPSKNPAGLIACLTLTMPDGKLVRIVSDTSWRAAKEPQPRWEQPGFDDSSWKVAAIAAPYGAGPWGHIQGEEGLGEFASA